MDGNHYLLSDKRASSIQGWRYIPSSAAGGWRWTKYAPNQACRMTVSPQREHSTFSIPLPEPNWNVFSSTRKSWKPNRHRRFSTTDLKLAMALDS
jgi:hypothetical protein